MALINFKLQEINKITPFKSGEQLYLHWFALTDGDLWLELRESTIYEYTDEALKSFDGKETKYNDYQISRFVEDFSEIFDSIAESVPKELYKTFDNFPSFDKFLNDTREWLEKSDDNNEDFYEHKYCNLVSWLSSRSFDSAHLKGGPYMWFLRNENKIKLILDARYEISEGHNLWTSPYRLIEMDYSEFVTEVEDFGFRFFDAMNRQIHLAQQTYFSEIKIDKNRLEEEHEERKKDFLTCLAKLKANPEKSTDWKLIDSLTKEMREDLLRI